MALNLKSPRVEQLVSEIARMTGESKTETIRRALEERKSRLSLHAVDRHARRAAMRFLEDEIWARIPSEHLGRALDQTHQDDILGYGPDGV